jgi:uncharacterized protein (TIGR03382 family)
VSLIGFIIAVIVTGLVVGALGRLAIPGPDPMGIGMTILVGVGGSLLGGLVSRLLFGDRPAGMILSVAGAALLVWLLRRRRPRAI